VIKKSKKKYASSLSASSVCSSHQALCNDIMDIKIISRLTDEKVTSAVTLLQKHDKLLYGELDPKQGLLWKWESNRIKIAMLLFIIASIIGYVSGNGIFPVIVKTALKACGLI
jgi:hypothetical protein